MSPPDADTLAPPPGQGTLADISAPLPAIAPAAPTMQPPGMPAPTLGEAFGSAVTLSDPYRTDFDRMVKFNGYKSILPALNLPDSENPVLYDSVGQGGSITAGTLAIPRTSGLGAQHGLTYVGEEDQENLILNEIRAHRRADPKFLPGVPDDAAGLHAWFLDQEKKNEGEAAATAARVRGVSGHVAAFAGGMGGTMTDPVNEIATLATIPIGGEGGFLTSMGRAALINGGIEAATLPFAAHNLDEIGQHLTARDALTDVATAAAGGALFDGAIHAAVHGGSFVADRLGGAVPEAVFRAMPDSVQQRWAGKMKIGETPLSDLFADVDNHELAQFAKTTIGEERMTPEEKAAANVVTRSQEVGDSSPFEPGPVGDAAHAQSLGASIRQILDGPRPENVSAAADLVGHSALTPPVARAPIFSPGLDTEFSAILGNEHGTGAHGQFLTSPKGAIGPAQVMPGTAPYAAKLAGVPWDPLKYHSDAEYNRALGVAYYSELKRQFGGDPLMAAAAYNAGPGSAARGTGLRGAMERARIAGEPERWVAYLPAETQKYVRDFERRIGAPQGSEFASAGGGALTREDPLVAADRASADQADSEASELAQQLGMEERREGGVAKAEPQIVPELRRDLFADEASWADAQAELHQAFNSEPGAPRVAGREPLAEIEPQSAANGASGAETGVEVPTQPNAPAASGEASGPITVPSYVDAYLRGEGRGDSPRDRELLQFAANNGSAIEEEFRQRALATAAEHPLTRAEIESSAPSPEFHDPLTDAALRNADLRASGKAPKSVWAIRDKATGELLGTWPDRKVFETHLAEVPDRSRYEPLSLAPETIDMELRGRAAADSAAIAAAADVRIDDPALKAFDAPNGDGQKAQVESLAHDLKLDVEAKPGATFRLSGDGKEQPLADILAELQRGRSVIEAMKGCL